METLLVILLVIIMLRWASQYGGESYKDEPKSGHSEDDNYVTYDSMFTPDQYEVKYDQMVKKQIAETEVIENKFGGDIIYANETSPYIEGTGNDFPEYPETLFLLLGKTGKVEDERDMLFYGSKNKEYIELRGGQGKTPISKDNAILGPMGADDFYCNFRVFIGLDYSELCEMGILKLDQIDSSIDQIIIAHFNYNYNKDKSKFANHLYIRNYIIGVKRNKNEDGWYKVQSLLEDNDMSCKGYVKDSFSMEQFSGNYSAFLTRRIEMANY